MKLGRLCFWARSAVPFRAFTYEANDGNRETETLPLIQFYAARPVRSGEAAAIHPGPHCIAGGRG